MSELEGVLGGFVDEVLEDVNLQEDWWLPLLSYNLGVSLEGCFNKLDMSLEAISIMLRFL